MFIFTREEGQELIIKLENGKVISFFIIKVNDNKVKIGIDCDDDTKILKEEDKN